MIPSQSQPRLQLDFYDEAIMLHKYEGISSQSYPIAVEDLVTACTNVPLLSGLLPEHCLFWGQHQGQTQLGIYVPAKQWSVYLEDEPLSLPLPPLFFAGSGLQYTVFALQERPQQTPFRLYHFPGPNVGMNGLICEGETAFPVCHTQTIYIALHLFLEGSGFNQDHSRGRCHAFPHDVRQLWRKLAGEAQFPLTELVDTGRYFTD